MVLSKPDKNIDEVCGKYSGFRKNCASPATSALTSTISSASEQKPILENVISLASGDFEPKSDLIDCEATLGRIFHENIISDAHEEEKFSSESHFVERRNG